MKTHGYVFDLKRFARRERRILKHLAKAWNEFAMLPEQHQQDRGEFLHAIHSAQRTIGVRAVRVKE